MKTTQAIETIIENLELAEKRMKRQDIRLPRKWDLLFGVLSDALAYSEGVAPQIVARRLKHLNACLRVVLLMTDDGLDPETAKLTATLGPILLDLIGEARREVTTQLCEWTEAASTAKRPHDRMVATWHRDGLMRALAHM